MAHKAETTETKEKPPNPEIMVTPPDATSVLSALAVAFVGVLVSTTGAVVVVAVPSLISGTAGAVADVLVVSTAGAIVVVAVPSLISTGI